MNLPPAKKPRRGFNLIEIAIVVVIIGILGSAVLIPVSTSLLEGQYDREEKAMERARMAVIGYAARSATPGVIIHSGGSTAPENTYTVPAGRAYLPCPDITGDGLEDRNHFNVNGIVVNMSNTASIEVNADGVVELDSFLINAPGNMDTGEGLLAAGACRVMRGMLPWRTLGLPPDDVWGNLRTYAVDYDYSHALVGFNHNTIADNFTAHQLVTAPDFHFPRNLPVIVNTAPLLRNNLNIPIALCLGVASNCENTATRFALGDRVDSNTTIGHRPYQTGDFRDGLIFVIVSHGRNGKGAARRNPGVATDFTCIPGDNGGVAANKETANYPFIQGVPDTTSGTNCTDQRTWSNRSAGLFTILRRNESGTNTFDDIIIWATRDDINEAIKRDSPDLPLYVAP